MTRHMIKFEWLHICGWFNNILIVNDLISLIILGAKIEINIILKFKFSCKSFLQN